MIKKTKEYSHVLKNYFKFILPVVILTGALLYLSCDRNDLPPWLFSVNNKIDIALEDNINDDMDNSRTGFDKQSEYLDENKK